MKKIHELRNMLCSELEQYGDKSNLDMGSLDVVDKLSLAIKNLDKIIDRGDGAYSETMGRYSKHDSFAHELRELMMTAPEETKHEFKRLIAKVEEM